MRLSNLLIVFAMAVPAFGYTDPGSGLLFWQILGSVCVGSMFYLRKLVTRLRPGRKQDPKD